MTTKKIIWGDYSAGRLRQRGFRRPDVRFLLARGIRTTALTLHGEQRWKAQGYIGRREASVIFIENATEIVIVTVQWEGVKPGEDDA